MLGGIRGDGPWSPRGPLPRTWSCVLLRWSESQSRAPEKPGIKLDPLMDSLVSSSLSSCLAGKFSHPEIVQLVSELEAERNANIAAAPREPSSWRVLSVAALLWHCVFPSVVLCFATVAVLIPQIWVCLYSIAWTPVRNVWYNLDNKRSHRTGCGPENAPDEDWGRRGGGGRDVCIN